MTAFRFCYPIEIRYGDLDPQGHVNNASYLTYLEQARVSYVRHLGLWDGGSFLDIGFILADVSVTFLAPILFGHPVHVCLRVSRLGNKSITMDYEIIDPEDERVYATANTVIVTYDYRTGKTLPIPETWRTIVKQFEGGDLS